MKLDILIVNGEVKKEELLRLLHENWGWYSALGASLVALGAFAIIFSFFTTLVSVVYLGFFITALGLIEVFQAFKSRFWGGFFLHLFLSVLYLIGGLFIALNPTINALTLTLLLGFFFIASGVLQLFFVTTSKVPHRGWLAFNGVISVLLGSLILYEWPVSGLWVIGTLVGVNAMITGWTWIALALAAKNSATRDIITGH